LAHKCAVESPFVTADVIEAGEFPDMVQRYRISGVPKTVVNDTIEFTGARSAEVLLDALREAGGAADA
jgi:predicted DsbA family dithiol-disulfide isomerase